MTIGYVNPEYNTRRNIVGKCPECKYVRVRSFKSVVDKVKKFWRESSSGLNPYSYYGGITGTFKRVDLYHFWDSIALPPCRTPYVTTFETTLPRLFPQGRLMRRGLDSLLSNQCRRLVALSEHAKRRQMAFDEENGIAELDKKITVLLPPQECLCAENDLLARQSCRSAISKLIFVGKDFFRKGGAEIVRGLVRIRKDFPIEAFLIGDYNHVDYASSWEIDSADEMRRLFCENASWLHHFTSMPNAEMLSLAKTCHIGLLPTRDDTFGYSVLEFQACGLPCVTTDVRALAEVNNEANGWLVKVPKLANGCADFSTKDKMRELSRVIEAGLVEKLAEALAKPESVFEKGVKALNGIASHHSPAKYGMRLREIYAEAFDGR